MAQRTLAMGFLGLVISAMMFANSLAQSGCTTEIISMAPCLGFISGNSSTPSSSCCSALANVVQNNPKCLCSVLAGGASSFGITINNTKALEMPGACKVQTPPVSDCNKVRGAPAAAPTATPTAPTVATTPAAPAPKAPETPATPETPTAPTAATTPAAPAPKAPETPATPETPTTPSTPSTPSVPSVTPAGSGSKATPSTGTTTESSGNVKSGTASFLFVAALSSFTVFLV